MPLTLELSDSQQPAARLLYAGIAQEKWKQLHLAQEEWDKLLPILSQLAIPIPDSVSLDRAADLQHFDATWGWAKKAKFILLKNGPLPTKKIVDILITTYEPTLDYQRASHSIPATLSADSRKGKFIRIEWEREVIYDVLDREKTIQEFKIGSC